jgi:hypothetical protein
MITIVPLPEPLARWSSNFVHEVLLASLHSSHVPL